MKEFIKILCLGTIFSLATCIVNAQCGPVTDDCDGDGVLNSTDLDDDNDGILDIDEGCSNITTSENAGTFGISTTSTRNLQNPPGGGYTYGAGGNGGVPTGRYAIISQGTSPRWHSNPAFWTYAGHTTGKRDDGYLAINGSTNVGSFFRETLSLTGGIGYTYSIWHAAASLGNLYALQIRIFSFGSSTPIATAQTGNVSSPSWTALAISFIPPSTGSYTIELINTSQSSSSNDFSIDDITFIAGCNRDTDGDSIPDQFDMDSDNDGCADAIEGTLNFSAADLDANNRLTGGVNANGIPLKTPSGQQPGAAHSATVSACNPIAYPITLAVTGAPTPVNLSGNPLLGSENGSAQASWSGRPVRITDLPTNGFVLSYNGTALTELTTIDNYTPTLLEIAPGPGTPAGTDTTSFSYAVIGSTSVRSDSAAYIVRFSEALPVLFGDINAGISESHLIVNWTSLSETNNDYFEVEVSADGKIFTSIGKVYSKADNGNSSTEIKYSFSRNISGMAAVLSILLMVVPVTKRKGKLLIAIILLLTTGYIISCNKSNKDVLDTSGNLYIRIAQVDKDGTIKYSKTIKANRE